MSRSARRRHVVFLLSSTILILLFIALQARENAPASRNNNKGYHSSHVPAYNWANRTETYPVVSLARIPPASRHRLPRVQHRFGWFSGGAQAGRQQAVKIAFQRCWAAYQDRAWLADELRPVTGTSKDHFAGWAATLVDALDTLWIMGLHAEFEEAVAAVVGIDFSVTRTEEGTISLFETTIRYLGGLLSAFDLSGDARLLAKAEELGHTLYGAFDTPNRMPRTWWNLSAAATNSSVKIEQLADGATIAADIGSLTLEFTRLSQLTGDMRWYDAISRIMEAFASEQNMTNLPGMWPTQVNAQMMDFHQANSFTVGALSDSVYEYLLKMIGLLGGSKLYEEMYIRAVETVIEHLVFRPMVPGAPDILLTGKVTAFSVGDITFRAEAEHLACFIGGLLALGGRLLGNATHIKIGRKLTDGCIWAYDAMPLGIGPEDMSFIPCDSRSACIWDESVWLHAVGERHSAAFSSPFMSPKAQMNAPEPLDIARQQRLPPGFTSLTNKHYILRPEAIESVFVLYRITGDQQLREDAWRMFTNIMNATQTDIANSAISDVTDPTAPKMDEMESFWLAETLKYFWLIFSEPSVVSLDEFVLNTEAHPLRRPTADLW